MLESKTVLIKRSCLYVTALNAELCTDGNLPTWCCIVLIPHGIYESRKKKFSTEQGI